MEVVETPYIASLPPPSINVWLTASLTACEVVFSHRTTLLLGVGSVFVITLG
jgi:hypothetical protein